MFVRMRKVLQDAIVRQMSAVELPSCRAAKALIVDTVLALIASTLPRGTTLFPQTLIA